MTHLLLFRNENEVDYPSLIDSLETSRIIKVVPFEISNSDSVELKIWRNKYNRGMHFQFGL